MKELDKLKPKIVKTLKKYKISRAGIFGSYACGEERKDSDLDIVVEIKDSNMSLLGFIRIKLELENNLKKKVDLVEYKAIKPELKDNILKEEVRIL